MRVKPFKTVEKEWRSFAEMVFHKTPVGYIQKQEMKKAFFAGAFAILCATKRIGNDDVSEEEGMQYLSDLTDELSGFYKKLIEEYSKSN